jgi:hypothetical protein
MNRSRILQGMRVTGLLAIGVLAVATAAWAPSRLDIGPGPTPPELAGVYVSEPERIDHNIAEVRFLRLSPGGEYRSESVRVKDDGEGLSTSAYQLKKPLQWYVERPTGLTSRLRTVKLCTSGAEVALHCSSMERDALTGNLLLGDRKFFRRTNRQLLVRLCEDKVPYCGAQVR